MTANDRSMGLFRGWVRRLRFPWLFVLAAGLFVADLVVPDLIPWVDELLLLVMTTLLGSWKQRKTERVEAPAAPEALGGDDAAPTAQD